MWGSRFRVHVFGFGVESPLVAGRVMALGRG